MTKINAADLEKLRELLATNSLKPKIQARYYNLDEVADALRSLANGQLQES